jgi:hypothetical protein
MTGARFQPRGKRRSSKAGTPARAGGIADSYAARDENSSAMTAVSSIAMRIRGDRLDGVLSDEWSIDTPSLDDLNGELVRLGATTYTTLTIAASGEEHLSIGGGGDRYIVYWTKDNEHFKTLVRPDAGEGSEILNVGGQPADYPRRHIVDLSQARAAANRFFLRQQFDPGQTWEDS